MKEWTRGNNVPKRVGLDVLHGGHAMVGLGFSPLTLLYTLMYHEIQIPYLGITWKYFPWLVSIDRHNILYHKS
jgi:hypothetical protein